MKKLILLILAAVWALGAVGCGPQENTPPQDSVPSAQTPQQTATGKKIPPFSFAEESKEYTEGMPGVKTEGFVNTDEKKITGKPDAEERAKNECTVEWDTVETQLDSAANIWKVMFYRWNSVGGDQIVYLDGNGKTLLIVYGE